MLPPPHENEGTPPVSRFSTHGPQKGVVDDIGHDSLVVFLAMCVRLFSRNLSIYLTRQCLANVPGFPLSGTPLWYLLFSTF